MTSKIQKAFRLLLLPLFLASCSTSSDISSTGDVTLPEYVGGEDWDDPWADPWAQESVPTEATCKAICPICGKCLDPDCTEHTEKCYDLNGRTKYVFHAVDDNVSKGSGSMGSMTIVADETNGYVGNFSLNIGSSLTFTIHSPVATVACLGIDISRKASEDILPFSLMNTTFNGESFVSRGPLKSSSTGSDWIDFGTAYGGCVNLVEGNNTFVFSPMEGVTSFNFKDMFLISSAELSLQNASEATKHVCTSKNAEGKCTDYDCNEYECLDKDETGWTEIKLAASDSRLKALREDGVTSMYNAKEDTIGEVNNHVGQKIAFAFSASEACYARISIEHNACGTVKFKNQFHMFFNGAAFPTEGRTGGEPQDWFTYYTSTVGYVKVQQGTNTFQFNHDIVTAGMNIKSITLCYQKGTCDFVEATIV